MAHDLGAWSPTRIADAAVAAMLSNVLVANVVLERFGLTVGTFSLHAGMLFLYLLLGVAAVLDRLVLSTRRTAVYLGCVALATTSFLINSHFASRDRSSDSSLFLIIVTYFPYIFLIAGPQTVDGALVRFVRISQFVSLCGLAQFFAQFFTQAPWLFDFSSLIPPILRGPVGFNTVISVAGHFKSNGFFLREPSGFSFLMTIGMLSEWSTKKRPFVVACHVLGLLVSYSGTGILLLIVASLFPLRREALLNVAALVGAAGIIFWTLGDALHLSATVERVFEFGNERSSGYVRYISPLRLLRDTYATEPWSLFLGHGPGTISRAADAGILTGLRSYESFDPTFAKAVFEYGVLGFILFTTLYCMVLNHADLPIRIRAAMLVGWLVTGGHLLQPEHGVLTLLMAGLIPRGRSPFANDPGRVVARV
jgi:hypothetical protein